LEKALEADADHSAAYLALGQALLGLGREEEAFTVFRQGLTVATSRGDLKVANQLQAKVSSRCEDRVAM
jgi:Tfp pilus assembly protein PilF